MIAVSSIALPAWWVGIILILIFSNRLDLLPAGGMYSTPPPVGLIPSILDLAYHAVLPVLSLTLVSVGPYLYTIRSITVRTAQEPSIHSARIRGLPEKMVQRQILRLASPPIVTGLVLALVGSFSGAILTETVFRWPGMGQLYITAILGTPDEGLITALTFVTGGVFIAVRFMLDLAYPLLDPRIRK